MAAQRRRHGPAARRGGRCPLAAAMIAARTPTPVSRAQADFLHFMAILVTFCAASGQFLPRIDRHFLRTCKCLRELVSGRRTRDRSRPRQKVREEVATVFILILCIAAMAVGAPIVAALTVTVASRREDAQWSLGKPARGPLEAIARRTVAFTADPMNWPRSRARTEAEISQSRLRPEAVETVSEAIETAPDAGTRNAA